MQAKVISVLRILVVATLAICAVPLPAGFAYYKLTQWWPSLCDRDPIPFFHIPGTRYTVTYVDSYCYILDPGRHTVSAVDSETGEQAPIFRLNESSEDFDLFMMNGDLHVIMMNPYRPPQTWPKVFGLNVKFHWFDEDDVISTHDYENWALTPETPELRAWALAHSHITDHPAPAHPPQGPSAARPGDHP